jgi:hypothetical protein
MTMVIALPGPRQAGLEDATARDMPAMPGLAALLAQGRRLPPASGWRAGALAAIGMPAAASIPDAAIAAAAVPAVATGSALCFASPLHLVAGISRVHLPPGGWLSLAAEESARWVDAFNHEFGSHGMRLHDAAGGWLLAADFAEAAADASPGQWLGLPLARTPATDEGARALRRLGVEVEMWLASHPLNRQRESRHLVPLNSLWFWGGARVMPVPPAARAPAAILVDGAVEPWAAGLAAACRASLRAVDAWDDMGAGDSTMLLMEGRAATGSRQYWQDLDRRWFVPLAAALRGGGVPPVHLQVGATAWQLPDRSPLRWLRRRRPWFEQVAA